MSGQVIPIDHRRDEAQLPHNIEAEAGLLGGMMYANTCIDRVAEIVQPEHFFEPLHGRIFSAILAEHSRGRVANPVTIKPYFDNDPSIREVGGVAYLAQLTGSSAAVIGVHDFAQQILELAQLRALIGVCGRSGSGIGRAIP
jgi:replicative DNA helicase